MFPPQGGYFGRLGNRIGKVRGDTIYAWGDRFDPRLLSWSVINSVDINDGPDQFLEKGEDAFKGDPREEPGD